MDREHESIADYSERMQNESIDAMIEREVWQTLKTAMTILNDTTKERVCLSRDQAGMVLSELVLKKHILEQEYEYNNILSRRVDILENKLVPQIKELLEAVSGRDYIESEY